MSTTYPQGKYQARILDQGFAKSDVKRTPYYFLQLKPLGRYGDGGELVECQQFERTYAQYLSGDTGAGILKGDMKAIGVEYTDLSQLSLDSPDAINLVGRTIDVVCEYETYQGKLQERWKISRSRKKLSLDTIRALNDQLIAAQGDDNATSEDPPEGADGVVAP
jgi:hypothetical protein